MSKERDNLTSAVSAFRVAGICALLALPFFASAAHAQADEKDEKLEDLIHDFESMRHESFLVPGMESLGFEHVETSDNWLKRFDLGIKRYCCQHRNDVKNNAIYRLTHCIFLKVSGLKTLLLHFGCLCSLSFRLISE